jgi:TonB-dependent SusC/RagA subfamily outer membrane receptor
MEMLIYPVKVAVAIAAFYTLYFFLFSKMKQFRFNRLLLAGSFLLSFVIPLITITIPGHPVNPVMLVPNAENSVVRVSGAVTSGIDFSTLCLILYSAITGIFMLHMLAGYVKTILIVTRSSVASISGTNVWISKEDIYPFTFFNKIILSEETLKHPQLQMILKHEKVHAREMHALDILLAEVLFLFQWFNPFAWLQRNAIRNNLEYLADQHVTGNENLQLYQMAMLTLVNKRAVTPFLNALNGNNLKNRIIMMKQKTENKNKTLRQLSFIPLLVFLILGLSNKEFKAAPITEKTGNFLESVQPGDSNLNGDSLKNSKKEIVVIGYPSGKASRDTIKKNFPDTSPGKWTIRVAQGQSLNDSVKAFSEKTKEKEVVVIGYGRAVTAGDTLKIRTTGNKQEGQPLYILDGKEIESIDGISPDQIESISVLKGETATALYGERMKNGVIVITSKNQAKPVRDLKDVLIILDGKETSKTINEINPDEISSVNVLKGESAIQKYGEKGKNGVVEITLKHP